MAAGLFSGISNKIYRDTAASWATPTWDEITAAKDVKLTGNLSLAEVKARLSGYMQNLPGIRTVQIKFNMIADSSIADYNILRDAWTNATPLIYAMADQAIATSGADYFKLTAYVSEFSVTQNLEEANMVDVTLDVAYSANVPVWTDVA